MPKQRNVILMLVLTLMTTTAAAISASFAEIAGSPYLRQAQNAANTSQGNAGAQTNPVDRANEAVQRKNFEEAITLYQEALRTAPPEYLAQNEWVLHNQLGSCYAQLWRFEEGIAEFVKSNSMHEFAGNYSGLGWIYNSIGDPSAAERNWQKAIEMEPDNALFYAGLAYSSSRLGNFDTAQRAIDIGRAKASTDEMRNELKESQVIVFLGRGKYDDAYQLANRGKGIYVDLPTALGSRISFVIKGGPAQLAGLEPGDVIQSINGEPTPDFSSMRSALDRVQSGAAVPIRFTRNGATLERNVIVGIQPNLPELTAAANTKGVSPGSSAPAAPDAERAVLVINRVVVKPATVAAGGQFAVEVSYTTRSKGAVAFTASIYKGGKKLFESRPKSFEAIGNVAEIFTSKINAANQPGKYAIRVHLSFGSTSAEDEATLTVASKK